MNWTITIRNQCLVAVTVLSLRDSGVDCLLGSTRTFNTISVLHQAGFGHRHAQTLGGSTAQKQAYPHASTMTTAVEIDPFPYEDVLPFLAGHVQPSDQILVLGCGTELPLKLSRDGYGTRDTRSLIRCVDSDPRLVAAVKAMAEEDHVCAKNMENGRLLFEALDVTSSMPELEQSSVDCIVDVGLLDKLVTTRGLDAAKTCLNAAHRAVRLGNPLVAMSRINRDEFAAIFEGNFGWMQELDGDPGAISQWYRTKKVNLKDVANNFKDLGLSFFVYTNVDNC